MSDIDSVAPLPVDRSASVAAEIARRARTITPPPQTGCEIAKHCMTPSNLRGEEWGEIHFSDCVARMDADRLRALRSSGFVHWALERRDGQPVKVLCGKGPDAAVAWFDAVAKIVGAKNSETVRYADGDVLNLRSSNLDIVPPARPKAAKATTSPKE